MGKRMIMEWALLFIIGMPIWYFIRRAFFYRRKKEKGRFSLIRELLLYSFIVYILFLGGMTIFPNRVVDAYVPNSHKIFINYIPFQDIANNVKSFGIHLILLVNILGNLILLLPLGFMLPLLWNRFRSFKKCFLIGFLASLSIELIQLAETYYGLVFYRATDIDDLIFNTISMVLGYLLFLMTAKFYRYLGFDGSVTNLG